MNTTDLDVGGLDKYFMVSEAGAPDHMLKQYHDRGCKDAINALETEVRNIEALRQRGIDVPLPIAIDRQQIRVSFPCAGRHLSLLNDPFLTCAADGRSPGRLDMEAVVAQVLGKLARIHSSDSEAVSSTVCLGNTLGAVGYTLPNILAIIRENDSSFYKQMMEAGLDYDGVLSLAKPIWKDDIWPQAACKTNMSHAETVFVADDGKVTLHDYADSRKDNPLHEVHYALGWGIGSQSNIASRMKRSRLMDHYLPAFHNDRAGLPSEEDVLLRAIDCCVITEMVNFADIIMDTILANDRREYSLEKLKVALHLAYQNFSAPMSSRPDIRELTDMLSAPLAKVLRSQGIDV